MLVRLFFLLFFSCAPVSITHAQSLDIEPIARALGLKTGYAFHADTGRGSSAYIHAEIASLSVRHRSGRIKVATSVVFPNLQEAITQLLDTRDIDFGNLQYHYGRLIYAIPDRHDAAVLQTRLGLRIRIFASRTLNASHSNTFHFNVAVIPYISGVGGCFSFDLGPKDDFANWAEDAIQDILDDQEICFRLADELVEAGIRIETLSFSGDARRGNLTVHAAASAPMSAVAEVQSLRIRRPIISTNRYGTRPPRILSVPPGGGLSDQERQDQRREIEGMRLPL
jgi:hypothetical protein